MRYEDTSGSISSSSAPEARDDADALANGSSGPATGNVITGAGTITGKAGADTPQSGHVVTVRGAGGTDSSDNGASLHVDGRFGTLVMDEHGSYKYVADGHAPANFRDLFQYTLADSKGGRSVADLVISRGGEIKVSENAQKVIPGPDGVVTLPAGVDLNDVHVVGRDLVINMPDGTQIIIVDGAVFVPQLVLGGVEVPSTNLAALLIDAEPHPAAGTPQSGGGNFEVPVGPLDPGVPLGDLIPPTELVFTPPTFHEVNGFINHEPTIEIQPDDQPASVAALDEVNEKGLPARNGGEPAGSGEIADGDGGNNSDTSETTAGTIVIDSQDTPNSVTINGVVVTGVVGQTIAGDFGTLTITGFSGQNILYSYTLADNTSGDNTHDDFSVTVTDHDGDTATATLTIDIIDDVPTARPDTDAVAAGTFGPETGNVLTGVGTTSGPGGADTVGADNAHISGVTGFNGSVDNDATGGFIVNGQYGVLTLQSDGSYSYTRNPDTPGGVNDVFNYTLTDGDGDTSTTTLTISIGDSTPHTGENPTVGLDDDALAGGNPGGIGDDPDSANTSGTLAGGGGDGAITFAVQTTGAPSGFTYVSGGAGIVLVQQGGVTVLTVTVNATTGAYTVVQNAPIDHPAGGDENNQLFTINYSVTDQDGDSAPGTFTINVDDDSPIAHNDVDSLPAGSVGPETGNVITGDGTADGLGGAGADSVGADTPGAIAGLASNNVPANIDNDAAGGFVVTGQYGTLTMQSDGSYSYTRTDGSPVGNVQDVFTYTLVDHDGDPTTATLTINISDNGPSTGENPTVGLDDDALAGGNPGGIGDDPNAANTTGTLSGSGGDGTLTFAVQTTGAPSGFTYTSGGAGVVLVQQGGVTVLTVTVGSDGSYSVVQNAPIDHAAGVDENNQAFAINYTVTDADGDSANGVLNISVDDDTPVAHNDADSTNPATDTADGNVITGAGTNGGPGGAGADSVGADTPGAITNLVGFNGSTDSDATGGFVVAGQYGSLTMQADGSYVYTRNPGTPGGAQDVFTYTLTDHDGDNATATLTITISDNAPVAGNVNVGLDDDALAGGNPGGTGDDPDSVNATGTLPGSGGDGALTFGVLTTGAPAGFSYVSGGAGIVLVQQGGTTVLTITVNSATGAYSVVQNAPISHAAGGDENNQAFTVNYTVTDSDGDVAPGTISISVDDDTPTILASGTQPNLTVDETDLSTNASASFASVFTNSFGADGPAISGSVTYALGVTGGNGVASGLIDVATGSSIVLVNNAGVIEGHVATTGGALAFTVSVNAAGVVTLDQIRAVQHPDANNPNDSVTLANDNLITLSSTITDKDGDPATATANIGQNLNFLDDGPSISASTTQPNLTVDETNLATNATGSFAGVFTSSFGADGAGTVTYALSITGGNGVASGLIDVATGSAIVLVNNAGVIEGHVATTGGALAFTVTVDASGNVTLDQIRAVQHPNASDPNDSVTLANDNLVTLTATVTDKDGDQASATANIGQNLNFEDDGPSAAIVTTGQHVSLDESVGVQADSNDTTSASVIALFSGVTNPGTDTDLPQYATNASAIVASTGSTYGADGAGTTAFSLNVSSAGVDSGLNTTDGQDIFLFKEGNLVVGRVGGAGGAAAFAIAIDSSGHISTVEYLSIQHSDATNPDDVASIANGAVLAVVTVTDHDGDSATNSTAIGSQIQFQDSGPVMTAADNINIQNSGDLAATGGFHYNLGADGAPTNNDVFKTVTFSAVVNGTTVQTTVPLTQVSETATSAQFSFSFDYSNGGGTAHETGTITFDKTNGTYSVDLDNPLQGISVVQTATGTLFQGYQVGTSTPDNTQPDVSVTQISSNLFVQFTGIAEPSSGTGANNLHTAHYNLASGSDADPNAFANGDLFAQAASWVSTSNTANGVAGDTIQGGEVLDFNLYATNPTGNLGLTPTASADTMFLKFDGIGASEDLIVVLKLYDTSTGTYTTKALIVENSDIQKGPGTGSGLFSGVTLDNNDGLIVIEPNDYQQGNTNLVIVGAQIAGSDEGITGSGINFNDAMGAGGASTGTQAFSTDVSDGPMKISSIGFVTTTTTAQTADLTFNVTIQDGDGDSLTQTIHATISASADSTTAISLDPSVTTVAPVVLDLNGDGTHFLATDAGVTYNYGHGQVSTAWVSPQDGILVNDANHDGNVNASEFVFGSNGQTDLQALNTYDTNGDGQLSSADAGFANFAVWQDANSNGVVDAGELQSLTARGIASISLSSDGISYSAAGGDVQVAGTGSYTRTDGSTGTLADAAFVTESRTATNSVLMGAIAAAGLAAEGSAVATTVAALAATTALTDIAAQHTQSFAPVALDAVSGTHGSDLLPDTGTPAAPTQTAALHASDAGAANGLSVAGSESSNQAPTELLQNSAPVQDSAGAGPSTAASIIMPAAAQLVAAAADAGVSGAQHNQVIGQVLADALHGGGGGPDIDSVLSSLPSQGGAHSALEALASQAGAAVPNGDSSAFAGFTAANAAFTMEHMMVHVDAAPTHA